MSVGAIQAGGASIVISASDQTAPGIRSATSAIDGMQTKLSRSASAMGTVDALAGRLQGRFLGIAAGAGLLNAGIGSAVKALEDQLNSGNRFSWDGFFANFSASFTESIERLPIVGTFARLGRIAADSFMDSLGIGMSQAKFAEGARRNRELFAQAERQRQSGAALAQIASSGAVSRIGELETIERGGGNDLATLRRLATQRANIELAAFEKTERDRAEAAFAAIGDPQALSRAKALVDDAIASERARRLAVIDEEFKRREERIRQEAEARARQERDLVEDARTRGALAALQAEELAADGSTPAARAELAAIAARRSLLTLEAAARSREERLIRDREISDEAREQLLALERANTEQERLNIEARLQAALRQGSEDTDRLSSVVSGTFSALGASRTSTQQTQLQERMVQILARIENNTQQGATF